MKSRWIDPYSAWLIKRPDQVLPKPMIDARLSSNTGIDLRHKSRRHMNVGNTTPVDRSSKPGQVAHDATTERQEHRRPLESMTCQHVEDILNGLQRFRPLSWSQNDRNGINPMLLDFLQTTLQVVPSDMPIRHNSDLPLYSISLQFPSNPL